MRKIATFLMASIIIGFLQVNCTVFSYFEYVRFMNMYNSTFITYVALVSHVSPVCDLPCFHYEFQEIKKHGCDILWYCLCIRCLKNC